MRYLNLNSIVVNIEMLSIITLFEPNSLFLLFNSELYVALNVNNEGKPNTVFVSL